ncbi:GNAT family N-acetyltransferase [Rhizobium sp. AU243]|uniref:GNAT family N-acetyltransferase n=1 Tax=Rhizobium sp. AU243 TaxID=2303425 RepID=UPI0010CBE2E2|nr:GNAT family N-acetyltransferase [Rhizobium sp. AU243]TKV70448.1 GNAT family N-acetyltransferase [Rhizobium sp. AU243]
MHERITRIDVAGSLSGSTRETPWRELLSQGEAVHRELRPGLSADYVEDMLQVFMDGAHVTQLADEGTVQALAVWRVFQTTYAGRRLEVDDLVTAAAQRSRGHGATLLRWLMSKARALDCQIITLNSANHRLEAHRFYEREGFERFGVHFSKSLALHPE